ncbi:DUF7674 family protein [Actinomadura alba]|uniref:DUF7674 domain-containing protein n=1 Tax=Actinomadura alba TaxID=406431 RepID=A0ABR7LX87_9ACTN|nr:hypothetical protein [Actinomadura alba]MBC6469060.1 hypothetical protein [Actinomadura alba]
MPASLTYERIADQLVAEIPEFDEHLEMHLFNNGELLQHVLFWDLTNCVLDAHRRGHGELVDRCLEFLPRALASSDRDLRALIVTSFVENVGPWDPAVRDFISSRPEPLRAQAAKNSGDGPIERHREPTSSFGRGDTDRAPQAHATQSVLLCDSVEVRAYDPAGVRYGRP